MSICTYLKAIFKVYLKVSNPIPKFWAKKQMNMAAQSTKTDQINIKELILVLDLGSMSCKILPIKM